MISLLAMISNEIEQQTGTETSLVSADGGLGCLSHGWTSNVKMSPLGVFLDKSEQKCCSLTSTTESNLSNVAEVTIVTLDGLLVLVLDWHVPDGLK